MYSHRSRRIDLARGSDGRLLPRPEQRLHPRPVPCGKQMRASGVRRQVWQLSEKLLTLGGTHAGVQKWKHKLEEAKEQESFPVKV